MILLKGLMVGALGDVQEKGQLQNVTREDGDLQNKLISVTSAS
jgi:hypothetical protein